MHSDNGVVDLRYKFAEGSYVISVDTGYYSS